MNKRLIIFISGIFQTVFAVDSVTGEIGWRFVVPEGGVKWEGLEEEEEEDGRRTIRAWGRRGNKVCLGVFPEALLFLDCTDMLAPRREWSISFWMPLQDQFCLPTPFPVERAPSRFS